MRTADQLVNAEVIHNCSHLDATVSTVRADFAAMDELPCPSCNGLGAFPATGLMCDDCLGGGEVLP